MNGCRFCRNIDTGDDYEPIVAGTLDAGIFGRFAIDAVIVNNGLAEKHPCLALMGCQENGSATYEKYADIKYCPICGREL